MKDVPGFLDHKNALNVARWRMRLAKTQGKPLRDLRPDHELVIQRGVIVSQSEQRDWSEHDRPTCLRLLVAELETLRQRVAA